MDTKEWEQEERKTEKEVERRDRGESWQFVDSQGTRSSCMEAAVEATRQQWREQADMMMMANSQVETGESSISHAGCIFGGKVVLLNNLREFEFPMYNSNSLKLIDILRRASIRFVILVMREGCLWSSFDEVFDQTLEDSASLVFCTPIQK